ncbi:hypothetical protein C8Q73DRAFT_748707 [Cubamyces lactineus]|nr:hypothetical protein C8Q73DRAFT_748707 [Cubamyces lactineus]
MEAVANDTAVLSYDVLMLVFDWIRDDYPVLFACSLVNRTFKEAAITYLYRKVTYSPAFSPVLDLRRNREDFCDGFFASARLPHNAPLVRRLEVSGYLSTRPPPLNKFHAQLRGAIECWPNLHTVVLAPRQYHESVFAEILPLLPRLALLRSITVNAACCDEKHAPLLVELRDLEVLTIESPTRAILQRLPDWLGELSRSLRVLRLTHSCGSVTPGVLRSFIPHLQNVSTLALGLSYSLTDNDVFEVWQELSSLQSLEFRYYLQLRPSITPRLPHLRHLTVYYSNISTREHANRFCRWIRRVITHSPLETLRLICENEVFGPAVSFDPLVEHLTFKHASRLRILDMRDCFVGKGLFLALCRLCTALEELSVSLSQDSVDEFHSVAYSLQRLHTVHLRIRNRRRRAAASPAFIELLMETAPRLRRVTIDGERFEVREDLCASRTSTDLFSFAKGAWTSVPDGDIRFLVRPAQAERAPFPWERGSVAQKERTHYH